MKINQIKNTPNFKGFYNNKILLNSLEAISNHGASFALAATFSASAFLKPLAIQLTPNVDKENKKFFSAEAFSSALMKLALGLLVSIPIENGINEISKNPDKYLKNVNFEALKPIFQGIKLGSNLLSAIPKSILTVALIPVILDLFSKEKKNNSKIDTTLNKTTMQNPVFINFKGNLAKNIADFAQNSHVQKFASSYLKDEKNLARNMSVASDVLLVASSSLMTLKSEKIDEKRKKPLILNKIISSAISIFAGCTVDEFVQKMGANVIEKFKKVNLNDPKLAKYLDGINILRPTLIFALIYYGLIPIVSTFASDKLSKK